MREVCDNSSVDGTARMISIAQNEWSAEVFFVSVSQEESSDLAPATAVAEAAAAFMLL